MSDRLTIFLSHSHKDLEKVRKLKRLIEETNSKALIEVDGGVNIDTGSQLVKAGADVLVAGNAVFKADDMIDMIARLKKCD